MTSRVPLSLALTTTISTDKRVTTPMLHKREACNLLHIGPWFEARYGYLSPPAW
jgi:hypothetical protein